MYSSLGTARKRSRCGLGRGCCCRREVPHAGAMSLVLAMAGWAVKAPTPSLTPMSATKRRCDVPGPMLAPVRSGNSTAKTLFSRFPAHCVVLMFNGETCQKIVRSSTGMSVHGDSHGKGNGIRYVFVVARFWCVATSRAWKAGTTLQAAGWLGWTTAGSENQAPWLAPVATTTLDNAWS